MLKLIYIFLLLQTPTFALEIDNKTTYNELLSHSEIYIDDNRSENIFTIESKKFKKSNARHLGRGYSPNIEVWIRFRLINRSKDTIEKVLEYNNPLTTYLEFYEESRLIKKDGLLNVKKDRTSLNPILNIKLNPYESKVFYIKASSYITTLIIELNLWSSKEFEKKERNHQIILALFFGAMLIMILYHTSIAILTKEKSYIYYVLFTISVSSHHFIYVGATNLYFSSELMLKLIIFFSLIVAITTIFLALYTQNILSLKEKYPKYYRVLQYASIVYLLTIAIVYITEAYQYRSVVFIFFLFFLFYIVVYALIKRDKQAYTLIVGWILFMLSALLMYLSSAGKYDSFQSYPYIIEVSLILEIIVFAFVLGFRIRNLNEEKLTFEVKKLLYKASEHRFRNAMRRIITFIKMENNQVDDIRIDRILQKLEKRVHSTVELYAQLGINVEDKIFSSILNNIKKNYKENNIEIDINCDVYLNAQYTEYCAIIIDEAVTNTCKYAFNDRHSGKIEIHLYEKNNVYYLSIQDNGSGFEKKSTNGLGLEIIRKLSVGQLEGTLNIDSTNGTKIDIAWGKYEG